MYVYIVALTGYTQSMTHTCLHTYLVQEAWCLMLVFKYVCECAFVYDCDLTHPQFTCVALTEMSWFRLLNAMSFVSRFHILDDKSSFSINIHITQKQCSCAYFFFLYCLAFLFCQIMANDVLKDKIQVNYLFSLFIKYNILYSKYN